MMLIEFLIVRLPQFEPGGIEKSPIGQVGAMS